MRLNKLVCSVITICAFGAQAQVQMIPLGDLAGGETSSTASALSGNGLVVAGSSTRLGAAAGSEAFLWTQELGIQGLGRPRRGSSSVWGLSPNGVFAAGHVTTRTNESIGMIWRSDGSSIELPNVVLGDVSNNGVATGSSSGQAIRWTQGGGVEPLGFLSDTDTESWAYAVSGDGSVIAGGSTSGYWLWTESQGMQAIGWDSLSPYDMTHDGKFLVGSSFESVNDRMVRVPVAFSVETGRIDLNINDLPERGVGMVANFASLGAETILGTRYESGKRTPYIWLDQGKVGMHFEDYLLARGFDLSQTGYELGDVAGISDDGTRFLLDTYNPEREREAVLFVIPAPASAIPVLGVILSLRRKRAD